MTNLLKLYCRQMWAPLVLLVLLTIFHTDPWGGLLPGILLMLVYNWNVSEKTEKSWRFFHALPLSFLQKSVVKIALPFLFSVLVMIAVLRMNFLTLVISGELTDIAIGAATIVLASILARGAVSFVLWLVCLYVPFWISIDGKVVIICIVLYLTTAIIFLSEKRIAWKPAILKAAAVCAPLILIVHYARIPLLNVAARSGSTEIRFIAAEELINLEQIDLAKTILEDTLKNSSDIDKLKKVISILEDTNLDIEIPRDIWLKLLAIDTETREEILNYFRSNLERFKWIDVEFFRLVEIDAQMSSFSCKDDCRALARLAGELSKQGNVTIDEYIKSRLTSLQFRTGTIIFGLNAAKYADASKFQAEIIKLLEHNSKDVRDQAEELLQEVVGETIDLGGLAYFLEGISSELSDEEKKKLRDLIEQYVIPNLKISVEVR